MNASVSDAGLHTRRSDVERLLQYQQDELSSLSTRMKTLATQIGLLERQVAHNTNVLSAARGLVGMRHRHQPPLRKEKSSRSRPKQRCWSKADGTIAHPSQLLTEATDVHLRPVGIVYSGFHKRFEAPRQSFTGASGVAKIILPDLSQCQGNLVFENLRTLQIGMHVWLMYWFDRNSGLWRNFVRPPRAKNGWRTGVFATRSPNRPSPVGLSLAKVESVDLDSCNLIVSGVDILDETPLVGLKAYNAESDSYPLTASGWLDVTEKLQPLYYDPVSHNDKTSDVVLSEIATEKLNFLNARSAIDIHFMVQESVRRLVDNASENQRTGNRKTDAVLPVGSFRVRYELLTEGKACISDVFSGLKQEVRRAEASSDPEVRVHAEFYDAFQSRSPSS